MRLLRSFASSLSNAGVSTAASVAVALSGGPDSLALAALTARWQAERQGEQAPAAALIVDHSLRAESGEEAAGVAIIATQLGLQPHVLRVDWGPQGRPRVQDKLTEARDARYGLLLDACNRLGRTHLLVAHHADDQAETFLVRLLHASGIQGLGCMPLASKALSAGSGVAVVRPLLGVRKLDLEQYCKRERLPFVVDPTNADLSYARNRLRYLMQQQAQQHTLNAKSEGAEMGGSDVVDDVLRLQRACAQARATQQAAVSALLRRAVLLAPGLQPPPGTGGLAGNSSNCHGGCDNRWCAGVTGHNDSLQLAGLSTAQLETVAQRMAERLPPATRFALCSVPCLSGSSGDGTAEAARAAALAWLLGEVSHSKYPASSKDGGGLARALQGGRLKGGFTGGGCCVQPVPGSRGKMCVVAPLAQQAAVKEAVRGAGAREHREAGGRT